MIICLKDGKLLNNGDPNIKIKFNESDFLEAVELITKDIQKKYLKDDKKIGLLGIARGGLPLLVAVSHSTGIREINVVQVEMTKSDNRWDYGEPSINWSVIDDSIDEFILFEDMVSHARSINVVIDMLKKKGKKVLSVYSLFMNNDMFSIEDKHPDVDINYVNLICQKQWVYFFWEVGYKSDE